MKILRKEKEFIKNSKIKIYSDAIMDYIVFNKDKNLLACMEEVRQYLIKNFKEGEKD